MSTSSSKALKQHAIPYFVPSVGEEEIESVVETLRSGWLTTGPKVKQFEADFADRVGAKYAIATSSCTAALHLALEACGIGRDDEVLVPTLTFASTAEVVVHLGGRPVLVDCRRDTMNMDVEHAATRITEKTKAIMPVHYGGQPCDMDEIHALAEKHNLRVIEDAAHAIPARYHDRVVGSISEVTCFSFYANKTMTTGEGGMLVTDSDEIAERARIMCLHGISKDAWKRFSAEGAWFYEIMAPGYKSNMTDIAAAIGLQQLRKADELWAGRVRCAEVYNRELADVDAIELPTVLDHVQMSWHIYAIRLNLDKLTIDRNKFIEELNAAGVGTSVHYTPLHLHPYYRDDHGYSPEDCPEASSSYRRIISLPIYPRMSDEDLNHVVETVRRIATEYGK